MSGVYNVSRDQINFDEGDSPFFDNINARLDKKKTIWILSLPHFPCEIWSA